MTPCRCVDGQRLCAGLVAILGRICVMRHTRPVSFAKYGVFSFLAIYYALMLVGILLAAEFKWRDGLLIFSALLEKNYRGFVGCVLLFPILFGLFAYGQYRLGWWLRSSFNRKARDRGGPPDAV